MIKTWCVGERHKKTNSLTVYEKGNPKTKKLVKVKNELAMFADVINHKFLLSKWQEEKFILKMLNAHTDIDQLW